jgi:Flavin reductase like domain
MTRLWGMCRSPRLHGVLATLECTAERRLPGGDHEIVVSRVRDVETGEEETPLLFWRGRYTSFSKPAPSNPSTGPIPPVCAAAIGAPVHITRIGGRRLTRSGPTLAKTRKGPRRGAAGRAREAAMTQPAGQQPGLGQPGDPGVDEPGHHAAIRPAGTGAPRWLAEYAKTFRLRDLTVPNMVPARPGAAHVLRRLRAVNGHAAAELGGGGLTAPAVGRAVPGQGHPGRRQTDGRRGMSAISVSNPAAAATWSRPWPWAPRR